MITNFKIFENETDIAYSVGDTVVCINKLHLDDLITHRYDIDEKYPEVGKKYKVLKCYDSTVMPIYYSYINVKNLNKLYVNVLDERNIIYTGIRARIFTSEIDHNTNKFNL